MSNRKELKNARRKLAEAAAELAGIEALPRRIGQRVRWSNGVIWTREGDDQWRPSSSAGDYVGELYPSAHVAATRAPWIALVPAERDRRKPVDLVCIDLSAHGPHQWETVGEWVQPYDCPGRTPESHDAGSK